MFKVHCSRSIDFATLAVGSVGECYARTSAQQEKSSSHIVNCSHQCYN